MKGIALYMGNANKTQFVDTRKFPPRSRSGLQATPMVWMSGNLVGPLIQETETARLGLGSASPFMTLKRLAHAGFPMIERREPISHMPGLTRNTEQLRPEVRE